MPRGKNAWLTFLTFDLAFDKKINFACYACCLNDKHSSSYSYAIQRFIKDVQLINMSTIQTLAILIGEDTCFNQFTPDHVNDFINQDTH